jgi:hypothetical protein
LSRIYHFTVPMPPEILRPNGRASWQVKAQASKAYATVVGEAIRNQIVAAAPGAPWPEPRKHGRLFATIHCRGSGPDPDNRVGILKPIIDVLQVANRASGNRYRLGLIENDRTLDVQPVEAVAQDRALKESVIVLRLEVWD